MFCHKCHGDLAAFNSMLDKMEKCPFCGESLKKEQVLPEQKSFTELCQMLKDKSSAEIFGSSDLIQKLTELDLSFQNARDRMSILCIRDIPGRMFRVAAAPKGEQEFELGACQKILMDDLGISVENSTSMLNGLQKVLFKKPVDIPAAYNDSTFTDPRDGHVYKTVRIGNQVWMAENLCYAVDGAYAYDNAYDQVGIHGYLYSSSVVKNLAVKGWHVPSKQEFEELLRNASMKKGKSAAVSLTSKTNAGEDSVGFNALYAGRYYKGTCSSSFSNLGKGAYFLCEKNQILEIYAWRTSFSCISDYCCSVRLVKDKV